MAWIESHQEILHHPKTRKLAYSLDISVPTAIGHLHCLWWWAMSYAQDGDLARYDDVDIAIAAQWMDDPETFVKALVCVGFLDLHTVDQDCKKIHDWDQYGGKLLAKREADAERKRRSRDISSPSIGHPSDIPVTAHVEKNREEKKTKEESTGSLSFASATAPKAKRAIPLPDDFSVTDDMANWALAKKFTFTQIEEETERFQNHAIATGRTQVDWTRAWMNWLTSPYAKTNGTPNGTARKSAAQEQMDRFKAVARGERTFP